MEVVVMVVTVVVLVVGGFQALGERINDTKGGRGGWYHTWTK